MRRAVLVLPIIAAACSSSRPSQPASTATPAAVVPQAAPAEPAVLRYTPSTGRYRVEASVQTTGPTPANITSTLLLTTRITPAGDQLELAATIDSFGMSGDAPPLLGAMLDSLRGRILRTRFLPTGQRSGWVDSANSSQEISGQLLRNIREMMGVLPQGTITPGATWTDTVTESTPLPENAGAMSTQAVREHRVVGWETRDSVRALHIATSTRYTITGGGEIQGTQISMDGTGTNAVDRWVSAAGVLLGSTSNEDTNITVMVASAGMSIPVRQQSRTTVTRLR